MGEKEKNRRTENSVYAIGGLGADKRVFKNLVLDSPITFLKWTEPKGCRSLMDYATKLKLQIKENEKIILIGVSFGGMVALEIAKQIKVTKIILISSVSNASQLPRFQVLLGRLGLLDVLPNSVIKPPYFVFNYFFGARDKALLKQIVDDTDPAFVRWALTQITQWRFSGNTSEVVRIHGTHDRIIPLKGHAIEIKNGGHFMIVDRAKEVAKVINEHLARIIHEKS